MNNKDNSLTNNRFGKYGWLMILFALVCYYFWAATGTDGLNVYPAAFSEAHGWDYNLLLGFATPAGLIGLIGGVIFGSLVMKWKVRKVAFVCLVITGALYILFPFSVSPLMYLACLTGFTFFGNGFGLVCTATLMANWFPRKKGIALGWATMGAPLCTATFVTLLSVLVATKGLKAAFVIVGAVIVVIGFLALVWVKNYPEEVGAYPDNIPTEKSSEELLAEEDSYVSPYTIGKLVKDKDFWFISLGFGLLWLVTVGIVSQFVARMMSVGHDQGTALMYLTVASVVGIAGSYFWGWLDQKIGTKPATIVYSASYIIALIFLILQLNTFTTYIAIIFVGLGIGGLLNLMPSLVISVYGRYDFAAVNRLVSPLASLVMKFAFVIMAVLLAASGGSYTLPYIIFIFIDVAGAVLIMLVTNKCKGKVD